MNDCLHNLKKREIKSEATKQQNETEATVPFKPTYFRLNEGHQLYSFGA